MPTSVSCVTKAVNNTVDSSAAMSCTTKHFEARPERDMIAAEALWVLVLLWNSRSAVGIRRTRRPIRGH